LAQRLGYAVNGLIYGLALLRLVLGSEAAECNPRLDSACFHSPWSLVGRNDWAFIIGLGFYQFYTAYSAKFRKEMNVKRPSESG